MTTKYVSLDKVIEIVTNVEKFYADNHGVVRGIKRDIIDIETLEIDTLQRYDIRYCNQVTDIGRIGKSVNGEYVKYSDLIELLNR